MTEFTPIASTIGSILIGLLAVLHMLSIGKIAGISGIARRLLPPVADDYGWRIALVIGEVEARDARARPIERQVRSA